MRPLGAACTAATQCESHQCVDQVCCDSACSGKTCQRCDAASTAGVGHCGPAAAGTDLDKECRSAIITCSGKCAIKTTSFVCVGSAYVCTSSTSSSPVASGQVCLGVDPVPVSKIAFCDTGHDCADGACRASRWWTSCDGDGACRPSSDNTDALKETIDAKNGASLTDTCGTSGTTPCDNTRECRTDALYSGHLCDGAGACTFPVGMSSCGAYACDPLALQCKTQCSSSTDCAQSLECSAPTCHRSWEWVRWSVTSAKNYTELFSSSVIFDQQTGLMWQRGFSSAPQTYDQALAYCGASTLGEHSDWRVPTRIELLSIVDASQAKPAIDSAVFPGTPSEHFWTSTPYATNATTTWVVGFNSGYLSSVYRTSADTHWVRCVR